MKKILIFLLILCLCGCAAQEIPTPPAEPETEVAEIPAEPVLPPDPDPILTPYMDVTVDGQALPGGCVQIEGTPYVALEELLDALRAEYTDPCDFHLEFTAVKLAEDSAMAVFPEENRAEFLSAPAVEANDRLYVPLDLCKMLDMSLYEQADPSMLYITSENGDFDIPEGYRVPTLMYHAVSDDIWGYSTLFFSPANMEKHLQYLNENGFTTIHFSDLKYIEQIEKPIMLTFDDGYLNNYTELYPLLQKYNCKATIFVVTNALGTNPNYMTWEQAKEMADSGLVSIQNHTMSHPMLHLLTAEEQEKEIAGAQQAILEHLGREPYVLCYPTGQYNTDTLSITEKYCDFALKMDGGDYITGQNPFEVNRWYVPRNLDLWTFMDMAN